jgi:hypothetical protein
MSYTIVAGDRLPVLEVTLQDGNGDAVDLTNASTATLQRETSAGTLTTFSMSFNATRTTGKVSYAWAAGETATADRYKCRVVITWSTGKLESFPAVGPFKIEFTEALS